MCEMFSIKKVFLRLFTIIVAVSLVVNTMPVDAKDKLTESDLKYNNQLIESDELCLNKNPAMPDDVKEEPAGFDQIDDIDAQSDNDLLEQPKNEPVTSGSAQAENEVPVKTVSSADFEISSSAIIVETYAELKSYILDDNGYTEFYFGADIYQNYDYSAGIAIPESKNNIIISGTNPVTGITYKYTEKSSAVQQDTIRAYKDTKVTIKDMIIDGYNHFGMVSAGNDPYNTDVYIMYDNITYNGPGLCSAPCSIVHIKNCNLSMPLHQKGTSVNMRICDAGKLILEGNVNIDKLSGNNPVFLINEKGTYQEFRVLSDSNVNINCNSFFLGTSEKADVTIESEAVFNCSGTGGMTNANLGLGSFTLEDNAHFSYYHMGSNSGYQTLLVNDNLNIGKNSTLDIRRTQLSSHHTTDNNVLIYMVSESAKININNPKRVVLVNGITSNPGGLIRFKSGGTLNIQTDAMNLWEVLPENFNSNIGWSDPLDGWDSNILPQKVWNQQGFKPIQLSATFTSGSPVNISSINVLNTYEPATPNNTSTLTVSNFLGISSKMFTLGKVDFDFNNIYDNSAYIKGESAVGSYISVVFMNENGVQSSAATIDETGTFSFSVQGKLLLSSLVEGCIQNNFLRGYCSETVKGDSGLLRFYHVPSILDFYSSYMPVGAALIERDKQDWNIKIEDTRESKNTWSVYATIDSPLETRRNGMVYSLPNALIYKTGSNIDTFGSESIHIYSGKTNNDSDGGITTIEWDNRGGPLIKINNNDILISNSAYTTTITWTLVDGPDK